VLRGFPRFLAAIGGAQSVQSVVEFADEDGRR
jgi:hypothetical protein